MLVLGIQAVVGAAFVVLILWTRNVHHLRKDGKDVYTTALPIRLMLLLGSFFFIALMAFVDLDTGPGTKLTMTESVVTHSFFIGLCLYLWYFGLYQISTDDKAIYYAAFFHSTIPSERVTRIVEKRPRTGAPNAWVHSEGRHLPFYVSGMLVDYEDLMSKIRKACPQAENKVVGNG